VGNELLLEHVHPNLNGYFLIADSYFKAIIASNILPVNTADLISTELIQQQMPLTKFDTVYGYVSNILLKENWPFNEPLPSSTAAEQTFEGKVAGALAIKQFSWKEAMEKLFNHYFTKGDLENALKIAAGQCLEFPFEGVYFERAAKLAQNLNKTDLAGFYLTKIWKDFTQNVDIAKELVQLNLRQDRPESALPFLNYIISNSKENQNLIDLKNASEQIIELKKTLHTSANETGILNQIADLYIQSNNAIAAEKYINKSLVINPQSAETITLKNKVEELK